MGEGAGVVVLEVRISPSASPVFSSVFLDGLDRVEIRAMFQQIISVSLEIVRFRGKRVLVMQELQHALDRGAKIYAEVRGYGMSGEFLLGAFCL